MLMAAFFLTFFLHEKADSVNFWTKNRFKNVIIQNFWKSTGLCPASDPKLRAKFLLSDDEKLNLDFIGALPNEAITMVRVHWILDLVTVSVESNGPTFHFEHLDRLIDRLYRNGLAPNFELMGNPSNYFRNFKAQSMNWLGMIKQIITRYSNLYGAAYVRSWRFELFNEPDLKQYNFLNFTLENYIEYFRTCEAAVPGIAGPGGLLRNNRKAHPLCWGLLDYCNVNLCNLNMITFHRKGGEVGSQVVQEGLALINTIISEYPNFKGVPFGNDEADIMTGWDKPTEWRADVRYAALVVQVIIGHIEEFLVKRNIPFEMLSNDNAFLSFSPNYFTQRTLLARFQMNNTKPNHVQFFRKPVYSVMGLLSLLGNYLKDVCYRPGEKGFSYVVTSHKFQDTFLGVVTSDRVKNETCAQANASTYTNVYFKIALENSTLSGMCVGYIMDNFLSNPHRVWKSNGSPDFPSPELRRQMRRVEGFQRLFIQKVKPGQSHIKFFLQNALIPSVFSVNICFEGTTKPGPVSDLNFWRITKNEILLMWRGNLVNSRCLLSYVVEFKGTGDFEFHKINTEDSIFHSYHFDGVATNGNERPI